MHLSQKPLISLMLAIGLLVLAGCGGQDEPRDPNAPIRVVATTGQITNIAQEVGGEFVQVDGLMGAGIDPHLYVASESDVELLQNADIIFYNGLFLEAQMTDVMEQLAQRKTVTPVAEHIPVERLLPWANYADEFDPHVWFDVTMWMETVKAVEETLVEFDPDHAAEYQANAAAYLARLDELDAYVRAQVELVPLEKRVLITAHDAFSYFGQAYGFEVRGLQGISTATEAGTADVQNLAAFIVERQIPAIFIESSVPIRSVEALQAAVQAQGYSVAIGGELFSDAMGNPGTPEGTYIGMVRHNIDTIVGALTGTAAE